MHHKQCLKHRKLLNLMSVKQIKEKIHLIFTAQNFETVHYPYSKTIYLGAIKE